LSGFRL